MNVLEEVRNVVASLNKIENYSEILNNELSKYDLMMSDLYHCIELNKFDSKSSYRMLKEIKRVLLERREVKLNLAVADSFNMQKQKLLNRDNRNIMMSTVSKCYKEQVKEDRYNIYTKEELDDLIFS